MRISLCSMIGSFLLFATVALTGGDARAHCKVETPNGGEVLRVGSKVTIKWKIIANHQQIDWDLWYSTNGASGPWIPIKLNMPIKQLSLVWTVPNTVSGKVRFRIRQDNKNYDTYDISDKDCSIAPSLSCDTKTVSLDSGGTVKLSLDADTQNARKSYWVFGSFTGAKPGISLNGVLIPLNYDAYTELTLTSANGSMLRNSRGTLDSSGRATATIQVPKGLPAVLAGLTVNHAVITFTGGRVLMASNPVAVKLVK